MVGHLLLIALFQPEKVIWETRRMENPDDNLCWYLLIRQIPRFSQVDTRKEGTLE